jgi:amino acid transporter
MSKEGKFGTFGGVFTPSLLTILGVIMYLRLPMVVGNAGLYTCLGIIAVSHVISICTGLSVSSIATDKRVGAGGTYYIVSRSLGLPIGGTLGLALFFGLSFSISLYVIGFSESFLSYWGIKATTNAIRICGTITVVAVATIISISTALAIKSQYLIFAFIMLSLASIFLGNPPENTIGPHVAPLAGGESIGVLFGIFFPAVTGFTAGVNMSGDLQNPKQSIPRGTMAAIVGGMAIYVALAVFLAFKVPPSLLIKDPDVFINIAYSKTAVLVGIWSATISSAMGATMGAPRILQAVSSDGITPRLFSKGVGKTNEPRNALILAVLIAEGGILVGKLNDIARIVSMVFLTTYGFLNLVAALESWASPDFRPSFRIPNIVSVIGSVTCLVIMIQLDLPAMLGATLLMGGLFLYLQRRQLELDSGDTWEGFWSSLVRAGLYRLTQRTRQQRNWHPNILSFSASSSKENSADFIASLIHGNGILTQFSLDVRKEHENRSSSTILRTSGKKVEKQEQDAVRVGVFRRRESVDDLYDGVENICKYYGFSGLEPNTAFFDWESYADSPNLFTELLQRLSQQNFNLLVYVPREEQPLNKQKTIDVWWREGGGNLPLSISLLRFISSSDMWVDAKIRLVVVTEDVGSQDILRSKSRRFIEEARIEASIQVINNTLTGRSFEDWVEQESGDTDLVLMALPNQGGDEDVGFLMRMKPVFEKLSRVLLFRASSAFPDVLTTTRGTSISLLPRAGEQQALELLPLDVPTTPDLANLVEELSEKHRLWVVELDEVISQRVLGTHRDLINRLKLMVEKLFAQVDKGLPDTNVRRQQHLLNRVQSAFLMESQQVLSAFENEALPNQQAAMEGKIERLLADESMLRWPESVRIQRASEDFKPHKDDSPVVRGMKRRRRLIAKLTRSPIRYKIRVDTLYSYYYEQTIRELLCKTLVQTTVDSHQLAIFLGKILNTVMMGMAQLAAEIGGGHLNEERYQEQKNQSFIQLEELVTRIQHQARVQRERLLSVTHEILQSFAHDINRLDLSRWAKKNRKLPVERMKWRAEMTELPGKYLEHQALLLQRAKLGVEIFSFQHRLMTAIQREKYTTTLQIRNGTLSDYQELNRSLETLLENIQLAEDNRLERPKFPADFKARFEPKQVIDNLTSEVNSSVGELPESIQTLSDESIEKLEAGAAEDVELIDLPVRRLVQFLLETELVGRAQEMLDTIPSVERHAIAVAQDVTRLIGFQFSEFDSLGLEEPGDLRNHMTPVIENGAERIKQELDRLTEVIPNFENLLDSQLKIVLESTNAYELTRSSETIKQHIRLHQSKKAVSGAQGALRQIVRASKQALVTILYRASAGVVLARTLRNRAEKGGNLVDRLLQLVNDVTPSSDTVDALPYYYRQIFFGQSHNDTFWVGRDDQLGRAKQAVQNYQRGVQGVILITGEHSSGKTALCQRVVSHLLEKNPVYWVRARPGGTSEPIHFRKSLENAVKITGSYDDIFQSMAEQSVVVIDDLELWWDRHEQGFGVIDVLSDLIQRYGQRCLFVLAINSHAYQMMKHFRSLSDYALCVLECEPVPADKLGSIISLRHGSTGIKFRLGQRDEEELTQWQLARLYSHHFNYARGNIGIALRSWILHVEKVSKQQVTIRLPQRPDGEVLDELRSSWVALMVQLNLHKQMSISRLEHVSGIPGPELQRELVTLLRMGLVFESRPHIYEINRNIQHLLTERMQENGVLS